MSSQTKSRSYERSSSPSPQEQCAKKAHVPVKYKETVKQKETVKYEIPSKESYKYRFSSHPIEEICDVTQYLALLPEEFKYDMLKFICQEGLKGPSIYCEYPAPPNDETVERINGKGGYFLKKTAEETNIYLVWYNRKRRVYMFWGALEKEVRDAMNRLRGRIVKHVIHIPNDNKKSQNQIADSPLPPPPPKSVAVTSDICALLIKHSEFNDYSEDEE